jgi:hypothetical protein
MRETLPKKLWNVRAPLRRVRLMSREGGASPNEGEVRRRVLVCGGRPHARWGAEEGTVEDSKLSFPSFKSLSISLYLSIYFSFYQIVEAALGTLGSLTTLVNCAGSDMDLLGTVWSSLSLFAGVLKGGGFGSDALTLENYQYNFRANSQGALRMERGPWR